MLLHRKWPYGDQPSTGSSSYSTDQLRRQTLTCLSCLLVRSFVLWRYRNLPSWLDLWIWSHGSSSPALDLARHFWVVQHQDITKLYQFCRWIAHRMSQLCCLTTSNYSCQLEDPDINMLRSLGQRLWWRSCLQIEFGEKLRYLLRRRAVHRSWGCFTGRCGWTCWKLRHFIER